MRGDLELGEDADVGGRPVGRDDRAGRDAAPQRVHGALPRKGAPPRDLEERLVRVVHAGHDADPLARQPASVHLLAAMPGGARHRERPLRVVALERLGEIGLVELAAAAPLDPERGGVGREALDQPVAHGVGGLEADAAAPRAFAQGQHEHEALGVGHPGLLRELARPQDALAAHAEGPAAAPAEVALLAVLRSALLHDRGGPAARAAFDFVGGAGRVVERRRADHVPDGLDSAAALGLAEVRHALLEVEDQVFGVHAAPIIAVYGVNDMAPWGHMYVNPGLTEPFFIYGDDACYGYVASQHFPAAVVADVVLKRARAVSNWDIAGKRQLNSTSDTNRYYIMRNRGYLARYMQIYGDYHPILFRLGNVATFCKEFIRLAAVDKCFKTGIPALRRGMKDARKIVRDPNWKPMPPMKATE